MGGKKNSNADAIIGQRVRTRRMLVGMSQERLGELLGLSFQQIQKYEKGVNRIGSGRLIEVAKHLGVPMSYFFDEAPGGIEIPAMSQQAVEVAMAFELLKPKMRAHVRSLVLELAGDAP
jgi:transcriptional regulator with XRE-family HTH domain